MSLKPEVRRGGGLPFGMVANLWMCDPRYSTNARVLYAILVSYADTQGRNTALGHPYRRELARQLGVSISTLDRTLLEMQVAGMLTIEERLDPLRPGNNDASIYHLYDGGVMWQGTTVWNDPLPPGVKAADAAKAFRAQRVEAKKRAGYEHRGGVEKGVSTRALGTARKQEGGVTHDATPGVTGDATLASPTTPNIYSPVHTPIPDASRTAEGQATPGFARAHARANAQVDESADTGGCAATTKTSPRPRTIKTTAARPLLGEDDAYAVLDALGLWERGRTPKLIRDRVRDLLRRGRTADHIRARVSSGWLRAQGPERALLPADDPDAIRRPVGFLATVLEMGHDCERPDCELGVLLATNTECSACGFRQAERAVLQAEAKIAADTAALPAAPPRERRAPRPQLPEQPSTWYCAISTCRRPGLGPEPDIALCPDCLEQAQDAVRRAVR
ncbi:hypothetical protein ACIQF6_28760 [Kitasatospora sp. NPDC092948]|uniref:hypothetical protein n=1 Tax=Kitasatospora sp. NPDC092948 TaxID=3364088 RepID=UPI003822CAFE